MEINGKGKRKEPMLPKKIDGADLSSSSQSRLEAIPLEIRGAMHRSIEHILEIGRLLQEAQSFLRGASFKQWLEVQQQLAEKSKGEEGIPLSRASCYRYMALAREYQRSPASLTVRQLTEIYARIAAPGRDRKVAEKVFEAAKKAASTTVQEALASQGVSLNGESVSLIEGKVTEEMHEAVERRRQQAIDHIDRQLTDNGIQTVLRLAPGKVGPNIFKNPEGECYFMVWLPGSMYEQVKAVAGQSILITLARKDSDESPT